MVYQDRHLVVVEFIEKTGGLPLLAFNLIKMLYKEKKRLSGRPFIDHFLEALRIATICGALDDKRIRVRLIIAILLHDAFEDDLIRLIEIVNNFSRKSASDSKRLSKKGKSIKQYIIDLLSDFVLVIAKLCDRIANLLDAFYFPIEKHEDYLRETREHFVQMIEVAIRKYPQRKNILYYLRGELMEKLEYNENILLRRKVEKA